MRKQVFLKIFGLIALSILPNFALAQDDVFVTNKRNLKAELSLTEVEQLLRPEILKIPSVRGIIYDAEKPNIMRIITSNSLDIRLDNFRNRLNGRGVDRGFETKKFVDIISKTIVKSDPFNIQSLRILIRSKEALDDFEQQTAFEGAPNIIVRRPFIGDLEEVIVAETKSSIAFMPYSRLKDLSLEVDKAFEIARNGFQENLKSTEWLNQDGLMLAKLDGAFDASILAIPEVWQSLEKENSFPIAAIVPNRGLLMIGRADSEEDIAKLKEIAKKEAIGPHALTDKVLLWKENSWVVSQ